MRETDRTYKQIDFPPLTKEQKKEIEALRKMRDEDINTEDIPEVDFSNAVYRYNVKVDKTKIYTSIAKDNLSWLKKDGKGYQKRLDSVIRWARANGCPIENM